MNCQEVKELLDEFCDQELSPEDMAAVEEHLSSCKECAAKSSMLKGLSRVVEHWEGLQASEETKRELVEKARSSRSGRSAGPMTKAILGIIAAALIALGAAALIKLFMEKPVERPANGGRPGMPAAAVCTAVAGRVDLVQPDGAVLDVRGRRSLTANQELRCENGSAAQLEFGSPWTATMVLRGRGALAFPAGQPLLKSGTLVFHIPPAPAPAHPEGSVVPFQLPVIKFKVQVPASGAVGLVSLSEDGTLRLAVKSGSATLAGQDGKGGMGVSAGKEISIDAGGQLSGPRPTTDDAAFDLLAPAGAGPVTEPRGS